MHQPLDEWGGAGGRDIHPHGEIIDHHEARFGELLAIFRRQPGERCGAGTSAVGLGHHAGHRALEHVSLAHLLHLRAKAAQGFERLCNLAAGRGACGDGRRGGIEGLKLAQ